MSRPSPTANPERRRVNRTAAAAFVAGLALLCGAASVARAEDTAVDRLETLRRALASRPAWDAEFKQEYIPAGMAMGEEANGRVWLAWPDRALFHTGEPAFRLMGLQGRTVRLVDLADETCDERVLTDREWERVPLAAILDPRGALVHFDVAEVADSGIVLIPKEAGGVDRVEVILGDDDLPVSVTIRDPQGAVNALRFTSWSAADEPPSGAWLPAPPEGVECVADSGPLD
jgi:hypothetical protein